MSTSVQRISKKAVSLTARLNRLRQGPASIVLPTEVKQVEMSFAMRNRDYGARRLLKMDIPSLLYKNPELEFKMNRPERIEDPSMVVRYADGKEKTIHLKSKSHEAIQAEFLALFDGASSSSSSSNNTSSSSTYQPHSNSASAQSQILAKAQEQASSTSSSSTSNVTASTSTATARGEVEAGVDVGTARE